VREVGDACTTAATLYAVHPVVLADIRALTRHSPTLGGKHPA
jgi:hypothetical protein